MLIAVLKQHTVNKIPIVQLTRDDALPIVMSLSSVIYKFRKQVV